MSVIRCVLDPLAVADGALLSIGDDWSADTVEHTVLDFKESPPTGQSSIGKQKESFYRLLAETAVCLANADGGAIVVGVRDRAVDRTTAISGVDARRYPLEEIVPAIFERTSPAIAVRPVVREPDGKTVYVLLVPMGTGVHGTTRPSRASCVAIRSHLS